MTEPVDVTQRGVLRAKQSAYGTPAATTDVTATYARRSEFVGNHTRNTIQSAEKRKSGMVGYEGHGQNMTAPNLNGELYPGAWTDFIESLVGRAFAAVTTITAASGDEFSIVSGVLIRAGGSSGSWLTGGLVAGMIVQLGASPQAGNEGRNVLITEVTDATHAKIVAISGAAIVDSATDANMTVTIVGKRTYVPAGTKTRDFYTLEDNTAGDTDASIVYQDCMVNSLTLTMQANQLVTMQWGFTGSGKVLERETSAAPYYTSPVAAGCGADGFAVAKGLLIINGIAQRVVTQLTITITWGAVAPEVAFANTAPTVARNQTIAVSYSGAALKDGTALRKLFVNETKAPIILALETVDGVAFGITLPKAHFNSNAMDDGQNVITESFDGTGLEMCGVDGYDHSVISFQDGSLV